MLIVVAVNLCVAFETDYNRIVDVAGAVFCRWHYVICLDLDAAKSVADAATSVASHQEVVHVLLVEFARHLFWSRPRSNCSFSWRPLRQSYSISGIGPKRPSGKRPTRSRRMVAHFGSEALVEQDLPLQRSNTATDRGPPDCGLRKLGSEYSADHPYVAAHGTGLLGRPPQFADLFQALANSLFDAAIGGEVVLPAGQRRRQALHIGDGVFELVRVLVALAVAPFLHGFRRRVAQVHGDRLRDGPRHVLLDGAQGAIGGVALGRDAEIDGRLRKRQIAFGNAQEVHRLLDRNALFEGARIGEADVFDRHADQAARDVEAILAGFEHAGQPVERGVRVTGAHGFVQRGNQVEMFLAAFVVEQHGPKRPHQWLKLK